MERLPVVLALTPVAERAVEHLLFGRAAVLEPRASAAEADELEQEVLAAEADLVLLSPDLSGLTAAHCARARASGARVVGVALDAGQRQELLALGADDVVEPAAPTEAILAALRGRSRDDTSPDNSERAEAAAREAPEAKPHAPAREKADGSVLAVIGSKGAPGASECAASLAALAHNRWRCLLVELDALGGGLDLRLGADPRQGSLLGLVRAVAAGDGAIPELLERWITVRDGWAPVLLGPPELEQSLGELAKPGAAASALRALTSVYPLAVADVGFLLSEGDEPGPAGRLHREAVVAADAVLLVLGARDEQLRAGLAQLDALLALGVAPERLRVVVDGAGGPGASTRSALEQVVPRQLAERRFALDGWLPWDGRALARARRTGLPLAAARRRGGYARALSQLLDEFFLPVAPEPRERKLRLVPPLPRPHAAAEEARPDDVEEEVALPWRS
jgi:Flp pilus assembly CpaE family ATPase